MPGCLGRPYRGQGHEVDDAYAPHPITGGQQDADARVIVQEDLSITSAWTHRTAPLVAHRDDRGQLPGTLGTGMPQRHKFRAWPSGEVEDVEPAKHAAVNATYGGAHGVHSIGPIGIRVDDPPGELDELSVFVVERMQVNGHGHPGYAWYGGVPVSPRW